MFYVILAAGLITAYINGMHDGGTVVATTVTSRILSPRKAVILAGCANFLGALLLGSAVAATVANGLGNTSLIISGGAQKAAFFVLAVFIGSMGWNILTWILRMPSSASHSLLGALIGGIIAAVGVDAVYWQAFLVKVVLAMFLSPVLGLIVAIALRKLESRLLSHASVAWTSRLHRLDLAATVLLSLCYGSNDSQKIAGVLTIAVWGGAAGIRGASVSNYTGSEGFVPLWIIALCAAALSVGTMTGGYNMIRTVGRGIGSIHTDEAVVSQLAALLVVEGSNMGGIPISSTQVITGTVMGAEKGPRRVNWNVAGKIGIAWILTLPAAGLSGWAVYQLLGVFGG
jgi:PiT family inorganic phosphate transporter